MLRTSSGDRPAWPPGGGGSAGWLATMPGARLARGTRRGRPAWVSRDPCSGGAAASATGGGAGRYGGRPTGGGGRPGGGGPPAGRPGPPPRGGGGAPAGGP